MPFDIKTTILYGKSDNCILRVGIHKFSKIVAVTLTL